MCVAVSDGKYLLEMASSGGKVSVNCVSGYTRHRCSKGIFDGGKFSQMAQSRAVKVIANWGKCSRAGSPLSMSLNLSHVASGRDTINVCLCFLKTSDYAYTESRGAAALVSPAQYLYAI